MRYGVFAFCALAAAQVAPRPAGFKIGDVLWRSDLKITILEGRSTPQSREAKQILEWQIHWRSNSKEQPDDAAIEVSYLDESGVETIERSRGAAIQGPSGDVASRPFTIPLSRVTTIRVTLYKTVARVEFR